MFGNVALSDVTVININTGIKTITDTQGDFSLQGKPKDELRFTKLGFERIQYFIKENSHLINIDLQKIVEIEEVNIKKIPTGDLTKDSKIFDEASSKKKLNSELRDYYKTYSTREVLAPKPGEFIQPAPQGFTMGAIDNQWTTTDFVIWIRATLTEDYFNSLGLKKSEVDTFIYYSLKSFNITTILKYALCTDRQLASLLVHFEKTILTFKKS